MTLVINFSGGKDSCAMLAYLCEKYPDLPKLVVFADTGWEHPGAEQWCRQIVSKFGLELHVARNQNKTFLTMALNRGKFPGESTRQCTSDLKRGPIATLTRRLVKDKVIINCMGLRAEESAERKKKKRLKRNKVETNSKRTIWDWLPIHDWSEAKVLSYLEAKNIPLHPVYKYLNRFSCRTCIYMSVHQLQKVKQNDSEAIEIISDIESKINFSFSRHGFLKDILT